MLQRNLPRLRAYVRLKSGRLVRARESCSDLVQSICREVLEDMPELDFASEAAFRSWLYEAAHRKINDRARYWGAAKREAVREWPGAEMAEAELARAYGSLLTPSRDAIAREQLERVERALDALPEHYREVILLARILGHSHAEIAVKLSRSESAVRTLLCRAVAELSEALAAR
jgi:RNA polymerase sigma-70 factor (ECF subfamily)